MADSAEERKHHPTRKRLQDARRRGQIARSRDLSAAVGMMAAIAALGLYGHEVMNALTSMLARDLGSLDRMARVDASAELLTSVLLQGGRVFMAASAPVAMAVVLGTVISATAQGGFLFSTAALRFSLERLSPSAGLKRLAPSRAGLDTLKAVFATAGIVWAVWGIVAEFATDAPRLVGAGLQSTLSEAADLIFRVLWRAALVLAALGGADYMLQKRRVLEGLMMTRKEVEEEHKQEEGRPEVKGRIRRIQRELFRQRMMKATEKATVVITNPTHYAVALVYDREKSAAPIVVAKGQDHVALRIREVARLHGVPIVENPPLARALHAGAEIGEMIPAPLFGAVAEVLAYLVRIRQLML